METTKTSIDGLLIIEPTVFKDDRGYFFESYNEQRFKELGVLDDFVQDNQSCSQKGVVRGLHFQKPPYAQAKLVRVLRGAVLDFAVDIRKGSPTYGKYRLRAWFRRPGGQHRLRLQVLQLLQQSFRRLYPVQRQGFEYRLARGKSHHIRERSTRRTICHFRLPVCF